MPYYYSVNQNVTTNGSANTTTDHVRTLTVANQLVMKVTGVYGGAMSTTAGGVDLRLVRMQTASTVGAAYTPVGRSIPASGTPLAASTTVSTGPTAGSVGTGGGIVLSVGLPATGGMGGWIATDPDAPHMLIPNGGAWGNIDLQSIAAISSVNLDYTIEFSEG